MFERAWSTAENDVVNRLGLVLGLGIIVLLPNRLGLGLRLAEEYAMFEKAWSTAENDVVNRLGKP
jgi:hypothetical protein